MEAWQRSTGSSAVTVAVFDSGIEYCNPDFDPARFFFPDIALTCVGDDGSSYPCCPPSSASEESACNYGPATDNVGHGTMVASVLAATPNNQLGLAGVDHECRVLSARVVSQSESGPFGSVVAANIGRVIVALETIRYYPIYQSVRVINMSFRFPEAFAPPASVTNLEAACILLQADDRFIVTTSTNDGVGTADTSVPNRFSSVITVGGIDSRGWRFASPCGFSSGTGSAVDFVSPGMAMPMLICQTNPCQTPPGVPSPCSYGGTTWQGYPCLEYYGYNFLNGTSFAAPMVCGAISLILSHAIDLGIVDSSSWEGLTWEQMYDLLKRGARDQVSHVPGHQGDPNDIPNLVGPVSGDTYYGWGLIDINASLNWLEALYCPNCD
ncbi:MAG: S8/S53 family peptidase [Phycisphaeraceae bacterium]|nr:S8/S53 family peptidase [Phycisphaeraceae bacterium]